MKLNDLLGEMAKVAINPNSPQAANFLNGSERIDFNAKTKVELFEELEKSGLNENSKLFSELWRNYATNLPLKRSGYARD